MTRTTAPSHDDAPRRVSRGVLYGVHAVAAVGIVLAACSSGGDDPTSSADVTTATAATTDDTTSTTGATADDDASTGTFADADSDASGDAGLDDDGASNGVRPVSFASDVQPILESNCASCHIAEGPGTVHLDMATAGGLDSFDATYIEAVVSVGYMPPWPAADGDVEFHDDRRLDDVSKDVLAAWAEQGGEIDVDPDTPIVPTRQNVEPIERDLVLQSEPYKGSADDVDDYRCQIFDPEFTESGFVQGYAFEADRTEVVHHALLFKAGAELRETVEQIDAADPDVGWSCTGLAGIRGVNQILSWAPGQDPTELPADTGLTAEPGDFFVVQIHYHYEDETADLAPDQSTLVIDVASDEVIEANGGTLDPVELTLYLGPAEIPCSTEETGPLCDRDAAIADLSARTGTLGGFAANGLMALCGASPDDFAEMTNGIASSTCDLPATPGRIVSVWGHEHEIGASFKMTLNPDTPDEKVLLDIPNWDFDWQLNYAPVEDIVLERTDVIRVECTWDRARLPDDAEPRYVLWAEGTDDEMCYSQIVTRPA